MSYKNHLFICFVFVFFWFWKTLERISILLTLWFRYLQTCTNKSFNVSSWSTFLQNYKKNSKILRKSEKNAFYSNPRHVTTELSKQWRNWIFGENGCRRKYLTLSLRRPLSYFNFTVYLYIKFQLNCFLTLSWNISVKETFSFRKLKISFSEKLLQRKPPHASLVVLF